MKYYDEEDSKILTKSGVKKALYPGTLPKNFTINNLMGTSIKELIDTPKPEITLLQSIKNGGVTKVDDKYYQVWEVVDKFKDIPGGLSKNKQESDFIKSKKEKSLNIKLKKLSKLRFEKETAGIDFGGTIIRTDLESQSKIAGAYNTVQINPDILINWKGENGWIQINKDDILIISNLVSMHIQSCYTREMELSKQLKIYINTDINIGWPE